MYLLIIAWAYVVLMMCVAEATSPNGTLLGAFFTFLLYGALPLSIAVYLLGTPARRRERRRQEALQEGSKTDSPLSEQERLQVASTAEPFMPDQRPHPLMDEAPDQGLAEPSNASPQSAGDGEPLRNTQG